MRNRSKHFVSTSDEQKVKTGKDLELDVRASSGIGDGSTRPWSIEEHRCYRIFGVDYANRCKPAEIEIIRAGNENQSSVEIILGSRALEIVY